jgi:hypothetical protein
VSSVSGAHRDSRIEGLEGTRGGLAERRDGVRVLGVDSVTDDSNDVVGSDSGEPLGETEGPGKGSGTDLTDLGSSEDTREGLDTDLGSEVFLAIIVVDHTCSCHRLPILVPNTTHAVAHASTHAIAGSELENFGFLCCSR